MEPLSSVPTPHGQGAFSLRHGLPLIATKLGPPRSAGPLLQRPRLLARLDRLRECTLALVVGGAGFGKTTLLSQWRQQRVEAGQAVAWLSLDEQDDSLSCFRRYLLAALDACPAAPSGLEAARAASQSPGAGFIALLINALSLRDTPLYVVIDDLHLIRSPAIHHDLVELIQHAPACLHLLLGSRSTPALPLSQLRARQQLLEIDAHDLRFDLEEVQAYFHDTAPAPLSPGDLQQLMHLTEGWITGIRLAALAPTLNPGRALGHGSRLLGRYLQEVVLEPLPAAVQAFLLQTAVLNRLTPELCNAVTQRDDGEQMLGFIEQHNLFISALDEQGRWFRFHALFSDMLYERLEHSGEPIAPLHERASNWLAGQQLWAEAIRHALAAGKLASQLACADQGAQSLAEEGDIDTLVRWLQQLPIGVDEQRIELQLNLGWALAHHFRFDESRELLGELPTLFQQHALSPRLRVKYQVVGAITEAFAENIEGSIQRVEPLLAQIPCGDTWVDGLVCNILSYGYLVQGRYHQAQRVQRHMPCPNTPADNLFVSVYRAFILGLGHLRQGDLLSAEEDYRQTLLQAERLTGRQSSGSATLAALLGEILQERGDWSALDELLDGRLPQIDAIAPLDALLAAYSALARRALARDEPGQANRLLEHAQQLATARRWPRLQGALLAEQFHVHLSCTQSPQAQSLLEQLHALAALADGAADPHQHLQRCAARCQAQWLMAQAEPEQAAQWCTPWIERLHQQGQTLEALRFQAMRATAWWQAGQSRQAHEALLAFLEPARRQRLNRSLLDNGPAMLELLQSAARELKGASKSYLQCLLDNSHGQAPAPSGPAPMLIHCLSERESQTLLLVAEGQSNKEIARTLEISAETVKWHLKNLYSKLQVTSRTQAMNRARELSLLD